MTIRLKLNQDDHFFGFGVKFGTLDKVGTYVECMNRELGDGYGYETYGNVPFFINPKGYDLFFHSTWRTEYHLGDISGEWFADGGDVEFFFIFGSADSNCDDLTGSDYFWHSSHPDLVSMFERCSGRALKCLFMIGRFRMAHWEGIH
ncbi:MAG: hypothetical protein JSV84_10490 [Gemmatimonadota bacterium]|nr:MAG: hypothetical protein JSV84_10490 [Gemmatimonadota bacterium]